MDVLNCVAVVAGGWQALIDFAEMAILTLHRCMLSLQWKSGLGVIELSHHVPFGNLVASFTFLTQVSLVWLSFFMAAEAS